MLEFLAEFKSMAASSGEVFRLTATIIGGAFALVVLYRTTRQFLIQMRSSHYSELDNMFKEILLIAIEKPYLRDKAKIADFVVYLGSKLDPPVNGPPDWEKANLETFKNQAAQYDMYAFIVFNFLETIHDRCYDTINLRKRLDESLVGTWENIIASEHKLHEQWFDLELNLCRSLDSSKSESCGIKFCFGFRDFILREPWAARHEQSWICGKAWKYRDERKFRDAYDKLVEQRIGSQTA